MRRLIRNFKAKIKQFVASIFAPRPTSPNFGENTSEKKKNDLDPASKLLREAAIHFLNDETERANQLVLQAKKSQPEYFAQLKFESKSLIDELRAAVDLSRVRREESFDKYDDEYCRAYWQSADLETRHEIPANCVNSMIYHDVMLGRVFDACSLPGVDGFLDFGCAYGRALSDIANKIPNAHIVGVDRQEIWKTLNDESFKQDNLDYLCGDVFSALNFVRGNNKVLSHVRTGIMVYPELLKKLYQEALKSGFKQIVLYEIASLSTDSWTFKDQGTGFSSEAHRSSMFIHDYVSLLSSAGFEIQTVTKMPHAIYFPTNTMLEGDSYVFVQATAT